MPYPYIDEPVKEEHPNVAPVTRPKPDRTVSILFTLLTGVVIVSLYLLATAPTGICMDSIGKALATCPSSNVSTCISSSYGQGYAKGIVDTQSASIIEGYARCITETQNATLIYGYCAAQQEFVASGQYLMNDTVLVVPASIIKSICK